MQRRGTTCRNAAHFDHRHQPRRRCRISPSLSATAESPSMRWRHRVLTDANSGARPCLTGVHRFRSSSQTPRALAGSPVARIGPSALSDRSRRCPGSLHCSAPLLTPDGYSAPCPTVALIRGSIASAFSVILLPARQPRTTGVPAARAYSRASGNSCQASPGPATPPRRIEHSTAAPNAATSPNGAINVAFTVGILEPRRVGCSCSGEECRATEVGEAAPER